PNLFFNPERWSEAYEHQKRAVYVFTRRESRRLVNLASKLVLYDKLGLVLEPQADMAAKLDGPKPEWIHAAADAGLCSPGAQCALSEGGPLRLATIAPTDLRLPEQLRTEDPGLAGRLSEQLHLFLAGGLHASLKSAVIDGIEHLANFIVYAAREGLFAVRT